MAINTGVYVDDADSRRMMMDLFVGSHGICFYSSLEAAEAAQS